MNLLKAHKQWAVRPEDERFQTLQSMHEACTQYRLSAGQAKVPYSDIRVEASGEDLDVVGKRGNRAKLSHWAMTQLSSRAGAPASYLRKLPTTLAAQNLNHGLKARGEEAPTEDANLLFHKGEADSLVLRAALSDNYTRIWNADITERLIRLQESQPQWKNPMAYVCRPSADRQGFAAMSREMEPAGLYASDHDMFAFLVDESKTLEGSPLGLNRGFFVWNSEVGASSFGVMTFLYDRVCGNNIVWGAKNVTELRVRHVGNADERAFVKLGVELRRYADSSTSEIEGRIRAARTMELGTTREGILDTLTGMVSKLKINDLNAKRLGEALDVAERRQDRYGNPNTLWAVASGLTEASQAIPHMDERVKVDRAAGKLLSVVSF